MGAVPGRGGRVPVCSEPRRRPGLQDKHGAPLGVQGWTRFLHGNLGVLSLLVALATLGDAGESRMRRPRREVGAIAGEGGARALDLQTDVMCWHLQRNPNKREIKHSSLQHFLIILLLLFVLTFRKVSSFGPRALFGLKSRCWTGFVGLPQPGCCPPTLAWLIGTRLVFALRNLRSSLAAARHWPRDPALPHSNSASAFSEKASFWEVS